MRTMPNTGPAQAYVVKGSKCAIALVAQSDSERWSTEPEVAGSNPAEGTRNRKLLRYLYSASCSTCVGSLTAEYRSPKTVGVRSRLTRRARTVLFGSLLTHGFVKPMIPFHPVPTSCEGFPILFGCSTGTIAPLAELVDASGSNPDS